MFLIGISMETIKNIIKAIKAINYSVYVMKNDCKKFNKDIERYRFITAKLGKS